MAAEPPAGSLVAPGRLQAVVGAEEIRLEDGRSVHLSGIHVPTQADGAGPLEDAARTLIQARLEETEIMLDPQSPPLDRHGRLQAQLRTATGVWLQGELVRQGLAVVAPAADVPAETVGELLALEREARSARAGLWAEGRQGPLRAERVSRPEGAYVLVTGRVNSVTSAREFLYVNFGADWRRDFTVRVSLSSVRSFARQGLDLNGLQGRNLEVRGYIFELNGPMIELVHPAQIEVLE